jgi:hypothetical protein
MLEQIDGQVTELARYRLTWRTTLQITEHSAAVNDQPYFLNWIAELYAHSMRSESEG